MVLNIVIGLLSVLFLFASSIKIFGWQKKVFEIQLVMFDCGPESSRILSAGLLLVKGNTHLIAVIWI